MKTETLEAAAATAAGLILLPQKVCLEAGIRVSVLMTAAAHHAYVEPAAGSGEVLAPCQDYEGRLWDVLYMLANAAFKKVGETDFLFTFHVVPNIPRGSARMPRNRAVELRAKFTAAADDEGPFFTLSLPTN